MRVPTWGKPVCKVCKMDRTPPPPPRRISVNTPTSLSSKKGYICLRWTLHIACARGSALSQGGDGVIHTKRTGLHLGMPWAGDCERGDLADGLMPNKWQPEADDCKSGCKLAGWATLGSSVSFKFSHNFVIHTHLWKISIARDEVVTSVPVLPPRYACECMYAPASFDVDILESLPPAGAYISMRSCTSA